MDNNEIWNPLVKFKLNDHDLSIIENAINSHSLMPESSNQDLRSCKVDLD